MFILGKLVGFAGIQHLPGPSSVTPWSMHLHFAIPLCAEQNPSQILHGETGEHQGCRAGREHKLGWERNKKKNKTAKQENRKAKPGVEMCCRTGGSMAVLHIRLHRQVWSDLHCRGEVGMGEQRPGMVVEGEQAPLAEAFLLHRPHGDGFRAPEGMTLQQGRRTDGSGLARAPGKGPGAILIRPRGGRGLGKTPGC